MTDVLFPMPPEDEIRRLRLQESIDQDKTPQDPVSMAYRRILDPGIPLRFQCRACQHKWDFPWEKGMNLDALAARMQGYMVCPRCGNQRRDWKKGVVLAPREVGR